MLAPARCGGPTSQPLTTSGFFLPAETRLVFRRSHALPSAIVRRRTCLMAPLAAGLAACATGPEVAPTPQGWTEFRLPGKRPTRYTAVRDGELDLIRAEAEASASMLRRPVHIEPEALGQLTFSWRVPRLIQGADLTDRDASDSPARIVLAFGGDPTRLPERTRAMFELAQVLTGEAPPYATLMYVWDNRLPPETVLHSPRTDRIRKIVVDSGASGLGAWRQHRRELAADFRRAFGEAPGPLVGLALMTDADNTRSRASAWYGAVQVTTVDGRVL